MSETDDTEPTNEMELDDLSQKGAGLPDMADTPDQMETVDPSSDNKKRAAADLNAVFDVPVMVSAVLGKSNMEVSQLLKLGRGAVVELDRKVGEAIDIYVNNRLIARGEVVVVEERLGITMTEIIQGGQG